MSRRHVVWMVLLLPLLAAPVLRAETPPVSAPAPPPPPAVEATAEVPGAVPEVQWLTGFLCSCFRQDPCTGQGVHDSTTCQSGQTCGCYYDFTDYVDGYTCYWGAHAYCH